MHAHYRLVLQRPIAGFPVELQLPELYREQQRIDPLLKQWKLPPVAHFLCPFECDETKGELLSCWFDAAIGRRLAHTIVGLCQGREQEFTNRPALLQELFALGERLDAARLSGNRWHLGLVLEFA
ncbi:hypothetical protein [Pseudomonas sp. SCB32]|uniref:hypothetical protein n=1 Tax=Pseudomonas sp. SCB32 TaxID=2653853 RepID=UPI001264DD4F|nr:hypothetical protein [Pseudomonas sp. SCB32]